jgi:cytochrome c oxidase cbb3-type subunit 3
MATQEQYDKETVDSKLMIDHDYDGIKELNNPPPAWLMWIFYGTIVWSVFYVFYYHVFYDDSNIPDDLKVYGAQVNEYTAEVDEAKAALPVSTFDEKNVELITDEAKLAEGLTLYTANCNSCHGASSIGPDLSDEAWLHGGSVTEVFGVIKNGVSGTAMTGYSKRMSNSQMQNVSSYILVKMKGTDTGNTKGPEGN